MEYKERHNRIRLIAILIIGTVLYSTHFCAQGLKNFTPDKLTYLEELTSLITSADKKEGKVLMEEKFTPVWNGTFFTDAERTKIYELSDLMLKKRMEVDPHFNDFVNTLVSFPVSGQSKNSFAGWLDIMIAFGKGSKKTDFVEFLSNSEGLIRDKTFFQSNTVEWKANNSSYTFISGEEPRIDFESLDLKVFAKGDSSIIYKTKGTYLLKSDTWKGTGGIVTWERGGLSPEDTYAEINHYTIRLKSSNFEVDSVLFHNKFFDHPLMGKLIEKLIAGKDTSSASYPYFESYSKRLVIKNIIENVDYDGGFSMKGNKLEGNGTRDEPARLIFYRDRKKFLVSEALTYLIKPDKISSSSILLKIYLAQDSIIHPNLQLKYINADKLLTLILTEEGTSKSHFYNTYHNLDMYFEALYWKMDENLLELGNLFGSTTTKAAFESADFYKQNRYDAMLGIDPVHPLVRVNDFVKKSGSEEFYAEEFASFIRLPLDQVKHLLIILNNQGFLQYDLDHDYVRVNKKLKEYILNRAGRKDYDVLLFNSDLSKGYNATIDLENYDMLLRGVRKIILSDSQAVSIYPDRQEVVVRKNRDFTFGGSVFAGNLEFYGSQFDFKYEEFKVDLISVDSCRLNVEKFNYSGSGRKPLVRVKNVIEGITGNILIDDPKNKSGLKQKNYPQYPIFNSASESFVYYDKPDIQGGEYERSKFYYRAQPFSFDSLDNFVANNVSLDGTLVSGGILPDIYHPLTVQNDYSLGFNTNTGGAGYAAYNGLAHFTNDITLNYNGLQGSGTVDYLTSTSIGEQFVFAPSQLFGKTSSFMNKEKKGAVEVPSVKANTVDLLFKPYEEYLTATSIDENIDFFQSHSSLKGRLTLAPEGMTGKGEMEVKDAFINSNEFKYEFNAFTADTANFRLASLDNDGLAFRTENVNARVDFDTRKGTFKSNGDASFVEFPNNQYICFMDQFVWYMDQNDMAMEYDGGVTGDLVIDTDLNLTKSNFFSTRPDQDSLNFLAPKALYDLDEKIIKCSEIEFMRIADAKITPDSGKIVIRKNAKMDPIVNAKIVVNAVTEFHTITKADVKINSRNYYTASGLYNYIDENKSKQIVNFSNIRVDSTLQTVASGNIVEGDDFTLSPAFQFMGTTELYANNKNLTFDGNVRIFHTCENLEKHWLSFRSEIDPNEIYVPIGDEILDEDGYKVGAGLMMGNDPPDVYTAFLSTLIDERDQVLLPGKGFLFFDKKKQQYQIGPKEKIKENNFPGNLINLLVNDCTASGEGKIDLGVDLGQLEIISVGDFTQNLVSNKFDLSTSLSLNFFFNDASLKIMYDEIFGSPDLKPLAIEKTKYEKTLKELLGLELSDKLISELSLSGSIKKPPDELLKSLFFAQVDWLWDADSQSYISQGKLSLASINKKQLFTFINGKIQIIRKRGGDELNLYLQIDENKWYFFNYSKGVFQAISSNDEFNKNIQETKDDKRKASASKGEAPFSYMIGSRVKKNRFLDDMEL